MLNNRVEREPSVISMPLINTVRPLCFGEATSEQIRSNPSNQRKSTRYTVFTFLPMALLFQLTRLINVFYLLNGVL